MGGLRLTPELQVLSLRLPVGGVVYSRPTAVVVERDGAAQRLRIVDISLLVQAGIGCCAAVVFVWGLARCQDRKGAAK